MKRFTLANGLRVVLVESARAPIVAVCVHYDVGFRSEPVGRSGFAHLFEHLMSAGAQGVDVPHHLGPVQACGGSGNASTRQDFTEYYQIVPETALDRVLFLEAARMRAPRLSAQSLRVQTAVVKEEIRLTVLGRPYGAFPWRGLPAVLYESFANTHDGYGAFEHLDAATPDECWDFFDRYYAPANAVLTVVGSFVEEEATDLIDRYFSAVPARTASAPADHGEQSPPEDRRGHCHDPHAPLPAVALGYRLPGPERVQSHLSAMVLAGMLTGAQDALLTRRLSRARLQTQSAVARCGLLGPLQARDPDTFTVTLTHQPLVDTEALVSVVDEVLAGIAGTPPGGPLLDTVLATLRLNIWRADESLLSQARRIGAYELLFGRAELIDDIPELLGTVSAEAVSAAATAFRQGTRAVLVLTAGAAR